MKRFIIFAIIFSLFIPFAGQAQAPVPLLTDVPLVSIKRIDVDLSEQRLRYYFGDVEVASILISSGLRATPSPQGEFAIKRKLPLVLYRGTNRDGSIYNYPRTKWNLNFTGRYYIHGAYWHNNFGHPMSHGCINVAYKDMEQLYNFAEVGTRVTIHE